MTVQRRTAPRRDAYATAPAFSDFLDELSRLTPWSKQAACRGSDINFIEAGHATTILKCLELCARCPVRRDCLEHAFSFPEEWGVWGGTTTTDRRHARRKYGDRATEVLEKGFHARLASYYRELEERRERRLLRAEKCRQERQANKATEMGTRLSGTRSA